MPRPKKAARFGGDPAHHNLILANLTTELFRHGRIRTTQAKAKTVQPLAEKMITFGKRGDVHARRQVLKVVRDKDVIHKLFADIGPANAERDGGYTRVLKLAPRKGDGAAMALIELVETAEGGDGADLTQEPRRRWSLRRRGGGTRSRRAREREEERLAAEDAGEDVDLGEVSDDELYDDEVAEDERVDDSEELEGAEAGSLGITREDATVDQNAPQADPAEVEARLAAAEAEEDNGVEVTEAPADSSVPPESPPAGDETEDASEDER